MEQRLKKLTLAFFAILFFALAWRFLNLGFSQARDLAFWVLPMVFGALGVAFLTFLAIVRSESWLFVGANLIILATYLLLLPKNPYVMLGGVVFFLLSFLFERRVQSDEKTRADFSLHRVIRSSVNLMVYALLFVVGFNLYAKFQTELQTNPKHFYDQIGHYTAEGLDYVPAGLKVSGQPVLGETVAGFVSEKIQATAAQYQKFFPAIFAILVMVILRWVAFVFVWLTMLASWLIFRLLLLVKFFRIEKVAVEVNKLQI